MAEPRLEGCCRSLVEFAGKYRVPLRVLSSFTPWDIDIDEGSPLRQP
jgi:hypothetical protein